MDGGKRFCVWMADMEFIIWLPRRRNLEICINIVSTQEMAVGWNIVIHMALEWN